jgi:hypothetical protein
MPLFGLNMYPASLSSSPIASLFLTFRCLYTALQAAQHPFITDEPYTGPYVPVPETPRTVIVFINLKCF